MNIFAKAATGITGYGHTGNDFIELLYKNYTKNIQLVTEEIHWNSTKCYNKDIQPMMMELINNRIFQPNLNYTLWTPNYLEKNIKIPTVLETVFETDKILNTWVTDCNRADITWVPSHFCVDAFKNSGVENVEYMPYGIKFTDDKRTIPQIVNDSRFKFLILNQWSERKFVKQTVQAFCKTFTANDNVILYIRSDAAPGLEMIGVNSQTPENDINIIKKNNPDSPQIIMLDRMDTEKLSQLYNSVDCLLASVRCEGVGRSIIESMSMGTPAIVTNYSSIPEFVNKNNGFLLNYDLCNIDLPKFEQSIYSFTSDMHWAEPNIEHLMSLMHYVVKHPEEVKLRGQRARKDVRKQFDWKPLFENRINSMESIL